MDASFRRCQAIPFTGTDCRRSRIVERILTRLSEGSTRLALWALNRLPDRSRIRVLQSQIQLLETEGESIGLRVLAQAEKAGLDESIHENDPAVAADLLEYVSWCESTARHRARERAKADSESSMPGRGLAAI